MESIRPESPAIEQLLRKMNLLITSRITSYSPILGLVSICLNVAAFLSHPNIAPNKRTNRWSINPQLSKHGSGQIMSSPSPISTGLYFPKNQPGSTSGVGEGSALPLAACRRFIFSWMGLLPSKLVISSSI